jgi:hypothetical protein
VKVTSRETPGATFTGIPGLGKQLISTKRTSPMAKCVFVCVSWEEMPCVRWHLGCARMQGALRNLSGGAE